MKDMIQYLKEEHREGTWLSTTKQAIEAPERNKEECAEGGRARRGW